MATGRFLVCCLVCVAGVTAEKQPSLLTRVQQLEATNRELTDSIIPALREELNALRQKLDKRDQLDNGHAGQGSSGAGQDSSDAISQRKLSSSSSGSETASIIYDGSSLVMTTHLNVSGNLFATTVSESNPRAPPSGLFSTYSSSTVTYSQDEVIACESVIYDTYNAYSTSTYKYTVPVSGIYYVYGKVFADVSPSNNQVGRAAFSVDGQEVVISGSYMTQTDIQFTYPLKKGEIVHFAASLNGLTQVAMWWGNTYWGLHMLSQADSIPTYTWF